jgi:hypothetical protein
LGSFSHRAKHPKHSDKKEDCKKVEHKAIKDHRNQTDDKQENNIPVSLFQSAKEENRSQDRASTNN